MFAIVFISIDFDFMIFPHIHQRHWLYPFFHPLFNNFLTLTFLYIYQWGLLEPVLKLCRLLIHIQI